MLFCPCWALPPRDRDYRIGSNFCKFYLIRTNFTLGEQVYLLEVFKLFKLKWIFWCSEREHNKWIKVNVILIVLQVSRNDLFYLLILCCVDEAPNVHQGALALLGDLAKVNVTLHQMDCPFDLVTKTFAIYFFKLFYIIMFIGIMCGGL
jgi:hypothetical protein